LRIIYQLNNSISSILIIFSFYIWCISWAHYDLLLETTLLQVLRSYHHIWGNSRTWTWAIIYSTLSHLHGLSSLKSLNLSGNMLLGSTTINGKVVNISWHLLLFTSFLNNIFWNLSMLHFFMIGLKTRSRSHLVSLLTWLPVFNSTHHRFKEAGISAVIAIPEDPISQRILI